MAARTHKPRNTPTLHEQFNQRVETLTREGRLVPPCPFMLAYRGWGLKDLWKIRERLDEHSRVCPICPVHAYQTELLLAWPELAFFPERWPVRWRADRTNAREGVRGRGAQAP